MQLIQTRVEKNGGRKRGTQRERERHVVGAGNVHKLIGKGLGEIKSNSE